MCPGLTLQAVLNKYGIDYQIVENGGEKAEDKVNLIAFDPANVTPAGGCDYYLCPEPAASTKIKGTASAAKPFRMAGDLQALYGGEEGYPQAVLVAKKAVLEGDKTDKDVVKTMLSYMERWQRISQNGDARDGALRARRRAHGRAFRLLQRQQPDERGHCKLLRPLHNGRRVQADG